MNPNSNSTFTPVFMPPETQPKYVFPGAYGGAVASENPPQIHDMMKRLRIEIGAVEAKKSDDKFGPKFPVRGAKDLAQKLANALNSLNMEAPVIAQEVSLLPTENIPGNERQSGSPVFRTLAHVKSTVRLIAPDTSFIDMVGSGHGGDVDDKSGGKASTYAWKDALLKGLSIPHEDMVDTDDDSSTGGEEPAGGRAARGTRAASGGTKSAAVKGAGGTGAARGGGAVADSAHSVLENSNGADSDGKGLAYVLAQIAAANTVADLEVIREAVKAGTLALHGSDRLAATKAFVERKKEIG